MTMGILAAAVAIVVLFGAEALYQRHEERRRQAARLLREWVLRSKASFDELTAAMRAFSFSAVAAGRALSSLAAGFRRSAVETFELDVSAYGPDPHLYRVPVQVEVTAYGDARRRFLDVWGSVAIVGEDSPSDEHSGNGDDLRRLDEVLEEQRQRIVALGRRV